MRKFLALLIASVADEDPEISNQLVLFPRDAERQRGRHAR